MTMLHDKTDALLIQGDLRIGQEGRIVVEDSLGVTHVMNVKDRIVATNAATLTLTQKDHAGKTIVLNSTHTQTITLPAATGTGDKYRLAVSVVGTDGSKVVKVANATDVMTGVQVVNSTATNQASSFLTSATSDTVTLNNTTSGGIVGTTVELEDIATGLFLVEVQAAASGTVVTAFSAAV